MGCKFIDNNKYINEDCNMQFPTSKTRYKANEYSNINGCNNNKYFTCNPDGTITMKATGNHKRCEFRVVKEFQTNTDVMKIMKVVCSLDTGSQVSECTIAQIHDNPNVSGINKPLLRICWIKDYKGTKNHFWASVKNSYDPDDGKYVHYDLGEYSPDSIEWKVKVVNNSLRVERDGTEKFRHDVTYYQDASVYFKCGIYNQDNGHDECTISDFWENMNG